MVPREPGTGANLRDHDDLVGLGAPLALRDLELDPLALFEGAVSVRLDRREVDENVLATVDGDEAVSLVRVEPLDGALSHSKQLPNCARASSPALVTAEPVDRTGENGCVRETHESRPRPTATGIDLTLYRGCLTPLTHQSRRLALVGHNLRRAARHRGDDRNPRSRRHLRVESLRETHVFVAHVNIDEPAQFAAVVDDPAGQARVGGVQAVDDLAEGPLCRGHLRRAAGVGPQDGGDANLHCHDIASWNASRVGLIGAGTSTAAMTASRVFSPSPELMITVSASGSSCPAASSLRSTPRVTPPAVSPKMPSVVASSRIESTTSSSLTSAIAPPVRRTTSST